MNTRRSDTIAKALEEMIFQGNFADGERLDEARLSVHFDVSRTPLREALQRLALSGLVELLPRRGAFVRQPGPVELLEMFETMAELEAACGRLAASRMPDEALEDLRQTDKRSHAAVAAQDIDTYYAVNTRFHHIIYAGSRNSFLEQEALKLQKRLKPFRRHQLRLRGRLIQSKSEHEAIIVALERGEPEQAAQALRAHVAVQGEKFHHLMTSLKQAAE